MSDTQFWQWVSTSPVAVRSSIVRHVTWWEASVGHHHPSFLMVTVACHSSQGTALEAPLLYDIRFECVGKLKYKITVSQSQPLQNFQTQNILVFGLLGAGGFAREATEATPLPSAQFSTSYAFLDPLDDKWRGPPATLWHIGKYVQCIVELARRHRRAGDDYNHFARCLMHVIGLRHYSFPNLASSSRSAVQVRSGLHDPSGIGMLFRALGKDVTASLALFIIVIVEVVAIFGAMVYGSILIARKAGSTSYASASTLIFLLWIFGPGVASIPIVGTCFMLDLIFIKPINRGVGALTSELVHKLGKLLFFDPWV
jgi:hypothetical protein